MARITYAELEAENKKLAKANKKLETENGKLNEQVEQLRESFDNAATVTAEAHEATASLDLCSEDERYEHRRRVVAENRAFELEQKVLELVNTFLPLDERRKTLSHLRLDRSGEAR